MSHSLFSDIIGHAKIREVLGRAVSGNQLAHAYLFVGPESVGKTTTARALLKQVFPGANIDAHQDVQVVSLLTDEKTGKQKSSISVEQIRVVKERLGMSANGYKAVFIEDADALKMVSANALLKTLEEPSGKTIIILRATHVESVPATIASRCQVIRFGSVARTDIASALEKRGLVRKDAEQLAALSLGRPGYAIRLYQDSAFSAERDIAVSSLLDLLGQSLPERLGAAASMLPKEDVNKATAAEGKLGAWEIVLRDILLHGVGHADRSVNLSASARLASAAERLPAEKVIRLLGRIRESRLALTRNTNPQLALEHVLLAL